MTRRRSRRKAQASITWKQFVQLYMESWKAGHTTQEFAKRCGLLLNQVHSKVFQLKRKGVELPKLRHSRGGTSGSELNVSELRALVAGYDTPVRRNGRAVLA